MADSYTVRAANWAQDIEAIFQVRQQVFVIEQSVEPSLEWDGLDEGCLHVIALTANDEVIGTGRVHTKTGRAKIGRMAVLPAHRGRGVGELMLRQLIRDARDAGIDNGDIFLHAQTAVIPFYERFGFRASGPSFDEANIPHRLMTFNTLGD